MRTLARAVYDKLNRILPDRTYHGFARDVTPDTDYCAFQLGPSFGRQYNGVSAVYAVQFVVPVTVNIYGLTDTTLADKLEEIIEDMEGGLTVGRHFCVRVDTVSHNLEEDPDLAEDGQVVWHAYAIFHVRLSRNVYESSSASSSSSSESSASASSASSASASSVSASSVSASTESSSGSSVSASSASSASSVSASSESSSTSSWSSSSASASSHSGP